MRVIRKTERERERGHKICLKLFCPVRHERRSDSTDVLGLCSFWNVQTILDRRTLVTSLEVVSRIIRVLNPQPGVGTRGMQNPTSKPAGVSAGRKLELWWFQAKSSPPFAVILLMMVNDHMLYFLSFKPMLLGDMCSFFWITAVDCSALLPFCCVRHQVPFFSSEKEGNNNPMTEAAHTMPKCFMQFGSFKVFFKWK